MRVSVIISTYNATAWLEKVICGYAVQSHRDFELLVADDGSSTETADCIDRLRAETGLTIRHVWHEKRGFRKCTILNRAIARSDCDYLVFSDGDCIPRWDFVAEHVRLARRKTLLSGGAIRLPMALSQLITKDDIFSRRVTNPRWLLHNGIGWNKKFRMLVWGPRISGLLDTITTTRATWNGGNASAWKADILAANGYDERMEHGGLDRELGERLVNAGIRPVQIRHRAICLHLDHARGYVRADARERNRQIREATQCEKLTRTPYGIERESGIQHAA